MLRYLSLLSRQWQSYKDSLNTARKYRNWQQTIAQLAPVNATGTKKLLIIRLDDIGDYILYRQCLPYYKQSEAWKEYNITLLGNEAWKPLFEVYDKVNVDNALWVNKKQYNEDGGYRRQIWEQLRAEGFETVICPARTRQLLLDDICALASHAPFKIGGHNQHKAKAINRLSDSVYTSFITLDNHKIEYDYNIQFVQKSCQLSFTDNPKLALPATTANDAIPQPYIVCFIGASAKSKRWSNEHWIRLIKLLKDAKNTTILVAGGNADVANAEIIARQAPCQNITGKFNLTAMLELLSKATYVISNDTMAAHAAVAYGIRTIIIANGNNASRFTEYAPAGYNHVYTLYPPRYARLLPQKRPPHYEAVSQDIQEISPESVMAVMKAKGEIEQKL